MSKPLILLTLAAALLAPAAGLAQPSAQTPDRHPGVYQFQPLPTGYCASRQQQDFKPDSAPARFQRLGELPPAYSIRLSARLSAITPPAYDPCATVAPALVRIR